ncbi:MAG: hypothetical protein GY950_25085 [bacterium]|nr:hypothetical protein [bacterium]
MKWTKKRLTILGLVSILMFFLSGSNLEAENTGFMETTESPDLFIDTLDRGRMDRSADPTIILTRFTKINFDLLPSAAEAREGNACRADFLNLNLFGGVFYRAALDRLETGKRGGISWVGHLEEIEHSRVILVYKDGIMAGNITLPGAFYQVRFAGNGVHAINQLDHSKFAPCAVDESYGQTQDHDHTHWTHEPAAPTPGTDSGNSIDVMVVYTTAARSGAGGTTAMGNEINLAVTETNQGYANSAITQRINLVHTAEISYTEAGNIDTNLTRLKKTSDGYMDDVHSLRDTYGADCVVLITESGGGYCGVAYLMTSVSTSFRNSAFAVVKRTCSTGIYAFAHELGHIMAARHDRYVDNTDNSPYTYNHGYIYLNPPVGWRTIMAYDSFCNFWGYSCGVINGWSNPARAYYGIPMGVAEGNPDAADNRKTLDNTARTVANFKAHVSNPGTATITVESPNGGETLTAGSTHTIEWSSTGTVGKVKIRYSTDNGGSWSTAVSSTSNDGQYVWTVPNVASTQCKVKISEASDGSPSDTSDAVFSIEATSSPTVTVTSPDGGENLEAGTTHTVTWSSTGTVGNVKIRYSVNNGGSWSTVTSSTANDGAYDWVVPQADSSLCLVKISGASGGTPSDTSDAVFSIFIPIPPEISLSRTQLNFGANTNGIVTGGQSVFVENSGGQTLNWSAGNDASWLSCTPDSGTNFGVVTVSVNPAGLAVGSYTGTVTISDANAGNSPQTVTAVLTVISASQDQPPFGALSTPLPGSTVSSSVAVTGWALDDVEVVSVGIYRGTGNNLDYIGDAVFVEGTRPDIETGYPGYPMNYKAGWGYMLLTHFLPNGGNGPYTLHAIAVDKAGRQVTLGTAAVTCDNAGAVKPFGAIDSPTPGGEASGSSYRNSGWVLTPQPNKVPEDGSTIDVYVDGVSLGNPTYNIYRSDIASFFPGYTNSGGAHAYLNIDTTAYSNGIHSIYWIATDNAGNADGIGSRFFSVINAGGNSRTQAQKVGEHMPQLPEDYSMPIRVKRGFKSGTLPREVLPDENGMNRAVIEELERIEVYLPHQPSNGDSYSGYMKVGDGLKALPVGSTLDKEKGIFYWHAGPGFLGRYRLVFVRTAANGEMTKKNITVEIVPGN